MGRSAVVAAVLLAVGVGVYVLAKSVATPPRLEDLLAPPPLEVRGQGKMDYDWRLKGRDGKDIDLIDMPGKVLFINLWEPWRPPCAAEMPSIQRLQRTLSDPDLVYLPVFTEDADMVSAFMAQHGLSMPVYESVTPVPPVLATEDIPTTYIVARDGTIIYRYTDAALWDSPSVVAFLKKLLAQRPPPETAPPEPAPPATDESV